VQSVAFVCSANICRSLIAHAICTAEARRRGLKVGILSAALAPEYEGMLAAREARLVCDRYRTPMPKFVSAHISHVDVSSARRIMVMERSHISPVLNAGKCPAERISLLGEFDPQQRGAEIEDPIGRDTAAFERCYERLRDCILRYLDTTHDFGTAS